MNNIKTISKLLGVFYILAFFTYGGGNFMTESALTSSDKSLFVLGAILMGPVHSINIVAIGILFLTILKLYHKTIAYIYFSAIITTSILLMVGTIFLLLQMEYSQLSAAQTENVNAFGAVLNRGNFYAYQFGMIVWCVGGILFTYLLFQEKLVPKGIAIWGFLGYIIFLMGCLQNFLGLKLA